MKKHKSSNVPNTFYIVSVIYVGSCATQKVFLGICICQNGIESALMPCFWTYFDVKISASQV